MQVEREFIVHPRPRPTAGLSTAVPDYSKSEDSGDEENTADAASARLQQIPGDWSSFPDLQHYVDVAEDLARPCGEGAAFGFL